MRARSKRAASTPRSPTPSTRTAPSPSRRPGFTGKRVINDKGEKGDANEAVIKALVEAGMLLARGRLKHQYPHSWRSKKPVIFRNTPQWFIAMDKPIGGQARRHLRAARAARDQDATRWVPPRAEPHHRHDREPARLGDLAPARLGRADRGVRAREGRRLGRNPAGRAVNQRIADAFEQEGADAWYMDGARERFLGNAPTRTGRRSTTSSTSGSTPARRTPSCWKTPALSASPASSAKSTAGRP
jgi:isoleucyl-tRNA synthetase